MRTSKIRYYRIIGPLQSGRSRLTRASKLGKFRPPWSRLPCQCVRSVCVCARVCAPAKPEPVTSLRPADFLPTPLLGPVGIQLYVRDFAFGICAKNFFFPTQTSRKGEREFVWL